MSKINELKNLHKITPHDFDWITSLDLSQEEAKSLNITKGVAMVSGKLKSGEEMTEKNVTEAAGAMRQAAWLGVSQLDIDHHADALPEDYIKKYGAELANPYPCGFLIDAQSAKITINNEERTVVEFLAIVENQKAYDMIGEKKFKGCSVVDYYRNLDCKKCDKKHSECGCEYEGSSFRDNTLILDEVPNSNATWVSHLSDNDLSHMFKNHKKHSVDTKAVMVKIHKHLAKKQSKSSPHDSKRNESAGDLSDYMVDGIWNEGKDSIVSYLTEQKDIDSELAEQMAAFLFENPEILNQYQLEWLSTEDLVAWWTNTFTALHLTKQTNKKIAKLSWLSGMDKAEKELNAFVPFGQGEVNFGDRDAASSCDSCRWSFFWDDTETTGGCAIVAGDIERTKGCDRFEATPGGSTGGDDETPEEPDEEDNAEDEVEPDKDGNCPDGYKLNEDGTMCIKVDSSESEENGTQQPVPVPNTHSKKGLKGKSGAIKEKSPSKSKHTINQELQEREKEIESQLKELGNAIFANQKGMETAAKREKLKEELERIKNLKKN